MANQELNELSERFGRSAADAADPGSPPLLRGRGDDASPTVAISPSAVPRLKAVAELQHRESVYRWLLAAADALAASTAVFAATLVWHVSQRWPFALVPFYAILINKVQGLYDRDEMVLRKLTIMEWRRLLQAAVLTSVGVYAAWHAVTDSDRFRDVTLLILVAGITFLVAAGARSAARRLARHLTRPERCLVMHDLDDWADLAARIRDLDGVELVGTASVTDQDWSEEQLIELISALEVHRLVVAPYASRREPTILEMVRCAKWLGVRVSLMPSIMAVVGASTTPDTLSSMVLLGVPRFGLTRSSLMLKRTLDIVFAVFWLIALAPLWLALAIAIRVDSPGPILFRQTRVGLDGQRFRILKFRSMVDGAESLQEDLEPLNEASSGFFKITDDPRVTRVGRVMRRTYLDELPQLINVLRGEMSFVGPRPLVEREDSVLDRHDRHRPRLTPGITGPWQLRGPMHAPPAEMVKLDYMYASSWSVWRDFDILLDTVLRALARHGC